MAEIFHAQGAITVKRLRNGDTLNMYFANNGIPLYQTVDPESGAVAPDWTVEENRPIRTPNVTSARGAAVNLSNHRYTYNGTLLLFNGVDVDGWISDSTGKFSLQSATGAIKIIGNLASLINTANDTLTYSCTATVSGVEYQITKDLDINIQKVGASSYYLVILAITEQLTSSVPTTTLTAKLYQGANLISTFYPKWLKGEVAWPDKNGQAEITVTRGDVDGAQLFVAEAYKTSGDLTPIARAGVKVSDIADTYAIVPYVSSTNKLVSDGNPVTVTGRIIKMSDNSVYTPTNPIWALSVIERVGWNIIKSSATDSIEVTTLETDYNGQESDVDVIADCEFE